MYSQTQQGNGSDKAHPTRWTSDDVARWLTNFRQGQSYCNLFRRQDIDGRCLFTLTDAFLKDNLGIDHMMHRLRLLREIGALASRYNIPFSGAKSGGHPAPANGHVNGAKSPTELNNGTSTVSNPVSVRHHTNGTHISQSTPAETEHVPTQSGPTLEISPGTARINLSPSSLPTSCSFESVPSKRKPKRIVVKMEPPEMVPTQNSWPDALNNGFSMSPIQPHSSDNQGSSDASKKRSRSADHRPSIQVNLSDDGSSPSPSESPRSRDTGSTSPGGSQSKRPRKDSSVHASLALPSPTSSEYSDSGTTSGTATDSGTPSGSATPVGPALHASLCHEMVCGACARILRRPWCSVRSATTSTWDANSGSARQRSAPSAGQRSAAWSSGIRFWSASSCSLDSVRGRDVWR
eukprot:230830_1